MRPSDRSEFTIAIICALTLEAEYVEDLFDETYERNSLEYGKVRGDTNSYVTGRMGRHNVVLCYMPGMGEISAANVATNLRFSYSGIELALVVGICGGVPYPPDKDNQDIFLGDVIISDSVIQYDFGSQYPGGFQRKTGVKDTLGRPCPEIRSLLANATSKIGRRQWKNETMQHLRSIQQSEGLQLPASDDILFESSFIHKHVSRDASSKCTCLAGDGPDDVCSEAAETPCSRIPCDEKHILRRRQHDRDDGNVSIHIGTIASANTVMKSGKHRDRIVETEKVLGFEMEGAGVWDNIPCIVIKGVSDYADSHKSREWQKYAAAAGASAAKAFLSMWVSSEDLFTARLPPSGIPRLPFFTGRTDELGQMRAKLCGEDVCDRIAVLQGSPGIGKSSLAVKYAEKFASDYSARFWLDASSPENLAQSFSKVKEQIENYSLSPLERIQNGLSAVKKLYKRYPGDAVSAMLWKAYADSEDVQAVCNWLSKKNSKKWLLIFDNYRSSKSPADAQEMIQRFFPKVQRGHVIITTQSALHNLDSIKLGKMKRTGEALRILSWTSRPHNISDDPHAMDLIIKMDGLPLAIAAAGSYISAHSELNMSCREYLELHEKAWAELQQDTAQLPSYNGNLYSCWTVMFDELIKSPDTGPVLGILACIDSQDFWCDLLDACESLPKEGDRQIAFNRAMRLLNSYGVVESGSNSGDDEPGSSGFNLQRSFHAYLVHRLNKSTRSAFTGLAHLTNKMRESGQYYQGTLRLLPHANRCYELFYSGKTDHYPSDHYGIYQYTIDHYPDMISKIRLLVDSHSLRNLAWTFFLAGVGKSIKYNLLLGLGGLENPGKGHFHKAEKLLLDALHKLDEVCPVENLESLYNNPNYEYIHRTRVCILQLLEKIYLHTSRRQELQKYRRMMSRLYRCLNDNEAARNAEWQARQAYFLQLGEIFLPLYTLAFHLGFLWSTFTSGSHDEFVDMLLLTAEQLFSVCSQLAFLNGFWDRRKTFALLIISVGLDFLHKYHNGTLLWGIRAGGSMIHVIVALPVLYYEVILEQPREAVAQ